MIIEKCREAVRNRDLEKALELGKQAVEKHPDNFESYLCLGVTYYSIGDNKKALENLKKAEKLTNDKENLAIIYRYIGEVLVNMKKLNNALTYLNKTVELTEHANKNLAHALGKIGDIYYEKRNPKKSAEYYEKALKIGKEQNMNEGFIARIINNFSVALSELGNDKDAIELLKSLLSYGTANNDLFIVCLAEINLGSIYLTMKDKNTAKEYFTLALNHAKELGDKKIEAIAYTYLGYILNNDSYLDKAEKLFKEINNADN